MDTPANQRKPDAVEQLAVLAEKAGMSLIELAVAFVINHPGVTSAIIGPRTMEQLEAFLPAADISLPSDDLDAIDAIDEIVARASRSTRSTTATETSSCGPTSGAADIRMNGCVPEAQTASFMYPDTLGEERDLTKTVRRITRWKVDYSAEDGKAFEERVLKPDSHSSH